MILVVLASPSRLASFIRVSVIVAFVCAELVLLYRCCYCAGFWPFSLLSFQSSSSFLRYYRRSVVRQLLSRVCLRRSLVGVFLTLRCGACSAYFASILCRICLLRSLIPVGLSVVIVDCGALLFVVCVRVAVLIVVVIVVVVACCRCCCPSLSSLSQLSLSLWLWSLRRCRCRCAPRSGIFSVI